MGSCSHIADLTPLPFEQTLQDENRRKTMAATIDAVCSRVSKERQRKLDKGVPLADLVKELGSDEAHKKKECMKEVCNDSLRGALVRGRKASS